MISKFIMQLERSISCGNSILEIVLVFIIIYIRILRPCIEMHVPQYKYRLSSRFIFMVYYTHK